MTAQAKDKACDRASPKSGTPRLRAADRRRIIVSEAAKIFADFGFSATTRSLADHMGVTQALLYKYFASKDALIAAVFEAGYLRPKHAPATRRLSDSTTPLADRLTAFYMTFFDGVTETAMRLFLRAALDGLPLPRHYTHNLNRSILWPVLNALRAEAKMPNLDARPPSRGERELVLMLHSSVVFLGIRRHVYRMPLAGGHAKIIAMHVGVYLAGALAQLRALHALPATDDLAIPYFSGGANRMRQD